MSMNQQHPEIEEQALAWVVRVRDRDFADWDAFEAWLAISPAHAESYHRLALDDRELEPLLPGLTRAPFPVPEPRKRKWLWSVGGGTLAAILVGLVSTHMAVREPQRYQVATRAGERRALVLPGGTTVLLNGGSKLTLDRKDPRFAELEQGEAFFTVVHDTARPFTVRIGEGQLVDVGTRFDIARTPSEVRIAVAEGSVVYNPTTQKLMLGQGDMLHLAASGRVAVRSRIAPEQVGAWRDGRFVYAGEPLSRVAEDLARYAGAAVAVSPDIADQPFRGVITVTDPAKLESLGPLFRAHVERQGNGWLISRH